jgi:hypothetical protein
MGEVLVSDEGGPPASPEDGGESPREDPGGGAAPPGSGPEPTACAAPGPVAVKQDILRITASRFEHAVEDLFEGLIPAPSGFPSPRRGLGESGYSTEAVANLTSDADAEAILLAAEEVALEVLEPGTLSELLPCASEPAGRACAETFLDTYGPRAYRRPLSREERAIYLRAFDDARADGASFGQGVAVMVQALLMTPAFLYPAYTGSAAGGPPEGVALDGYSLASRLAALLWDSVPDARLLELARSGELEAPEVLAREARRMLSDPKSARGLGRWVSEWLMVGDLEAESRDPSLYPDFGPELGAAMEEELRRLAVDAFRGGRTLAELLAGRRTFVNPDLAALYGLSGLDFTGADGWLEAELPEEQRAGVFTRAAVLTAHAHRRASSYVQRGYTLRKRLFCETFSAPPADALSRQPEYPPNATGRERSEILRNVSDCAGCHALLDPVGLTFEVYDAVGGWREEMPGGKMIDPSGDIPGAPDVSGFVPGPIELSERLAQADSVRTCFVRQMLRFTLGRLDDQPGDACVVERIDAAFAASGGRLDALVEALVTSDAFRYRRKS